MLPCSVRRAVANAPPSTLLSTLPRATATCTYRPYQCRRYSSSKPSRSSGSEGPPSSKPSSKPARSNGSGDPAVRQAVQPATEAKTGEAKPPGEKRKRKTKDASDKLKYPSVPTTAHIPSGFFALSSFFSLHRPISVTHGLPRNVTDDAFAAIFAPASQLSSRSVKDKVTEVTTTISRTIDNIDQRHSALRSSMSEQQLQAIDADADSEAHNDQMHKLDLRSANGSAASLTVQVNNMAGQFSPFHPPPVPQAETAVSRRVKAIYAKKAAEAAEHAASSGLDENSSSGSLQEPVQTRRYKAVFTIDEATDANGEIKIVAHSPELIEHPDASSPSTSGAVLASVRGRRSPHSAGVTVSVARGDGMSTIVVPAPRSFLERMALRQLKFEEAQTRMRRSIWSAISVRRQRKLKMKKKKYKKLTKRLRHERLKQGRA